MVTAMALLAWAAVLAVARVWGQSLLDDGLVIRLGAPPLVGWDDLRVSWKVVHPVVVGVGAVVLLPRLAAELRWRTLLLVAAGVAALWAVALALSTGVGWEGLLRPTILKGDEYLLEVPGVGSPGDFLAHFVERLDGYVTHVRSHPPGLVLVLWALDRIGLGGRGWAATLMIGGGAAAVPAILVTTRHLAGEEVARRAAPFVAVAPAAIWVATSADALFAGVGAWAATAIVLSSARRDATGDRLAVVGGLGFGVGLMLSYGLLGLLAVPAVVCGVRRQLRPLVLAGAALVAVLGAVALTGFRWPEGLAATGEQYRASVAATRPFSYFVFSNVAALFVALGPAMAVALARVRDRRLWLVLAGPLLAVTAADLSGLSKGEVERIWLPFSLWALTAGAALAVGRHPGAATRRWLALQVVFAIAVQVAIRTRW